MFPTGLEDAPTATSGIVTTEKAYHFETSSFLPNVTQAEVWEQIGTWTGVNYELSPIVRMNHPDAFFRLADIPADGKSHFTSTLFLFGFLPFDRYKFAFVECKEPQFFDECSANFSAKVWTHKRTLTPQDGGVVVTDTCSVVPRIPFLGPLLGRVYRAVFAHRHKRLQAFFAGNMRGA